MPKYKAYNIKGTLPRGIKPVATQQMPQNRNPPNKVFFLPILSRVMTAITSPGIVAKEERAKLVYLLPGRDIELIIRP